jgi:putative endonuclease
MGQAYVYILGNRGGMLYIGATTDLERRVHEHKTKVVRGYTRKYSIQKLLYFQEFNELDEALEAERYLKGLLRSKKLELIKEMNPKFEDLSKYWFED